MPKLKARVASSGVPRSGLLPYPKPIKLTLAKSLGGKTPYIRFITTDERKGEKNLPDFFKAGPGERATEKNGVVVGLGDLKKLDHDTFADTVRSALAKAATEFDSYAILIDQSVIEKINFSPAIRIVVTAQANAEAPADILKSVKNQKKVLVQSTELVLPQNFHAAAEPVLKSALVEARHVVAMRQIQQLPGNYLTPQTMTARAKELAAQHKLSLKVMGRAELVRMGAGGILAVSQGSACEPQFIVLEYRHVSAKKTLALIGKGVTFDTGGISLKPGADMHEMKYDMSGSAMALTSLASIAEQKIPVNVVCALAMVENMPSGNAFKPGDVYVALNGQSVEVQNTDAEGRLVLADALTYVQNNYKTDLMIDMATLTGACVVALGDFYSGLFTNTKIARTAIERAAEASLEPVWALPVGPRYRKLLDSNVADLNNIGGRYGGASSAAEFLHAFIDEGRAWAHLDIAGVAMIKKPFHVYTGAGSGYGVRLLSELARQMVE